MLQSFHESCLIAVRRSLSVGVMLRSVSDLARSRRCLCWCRIKPILQGREACMNCHACANGLHGEAGKISGLYRGPIPLVREATAEQKPGADEAPERMLHMLQAFENTESLGSTTVCQVLSLHILKKSLSEHVNSILKFKTVDDSARRCFCTGPQRLG